MYRNAIIVLVVFVFSIPISSCLYFFYSLITKVNGYSCIFYLLIEHSTWVPKQNIWYWIFFFSIHSMNFKVSLFLFMKIMEIGCIYISWKILHTDIFFFFHGFKLNFFFFYCTLEDIIIIQEDQGIFCDFIYWTRFCFDFYSTMYNYSH